LYVLTTVVSGINIEEQEKEDQGYLRHIRKKNLVSGEIIINSRLVVRIHRNVFRDAQQDPHPSTQLLDEENCQERVRIKQKRKKPFSRGLMEDKETEKEKLNSNEEGGEHKRTRAPKQVEYNAFVDRNELLDNGTL
jgi:hypothetical protein